MNFTYLLLYELFDMNKKDGLDEWSVWKITIFILLVVGCTCICINYFKHWKQNVENVINNSMNE